jgi:hypothetical protein
LAYVSEILDDGSISVSERVVSAKKDAVWKQSDISVGDIQSSRDSSFIDLIPDDEQSGL